jgi:microsomal epoxide hydrolase
MPAWIWEPQIAYFSRTYRVVAMDPRSQGESTQTPEGLYPAARARDIKAVVEQLKLAPVVLVGWSMGVTELASYVDQFGTTDLAGLVFVDGIAGSDFDPKVTPQLFKFAASIQADRRKQTEGFVRFMYKKPQSEEYLQRVTAAALDTPTNSAMALFLGAFTSDYRPALAKIDKPALIVTAGGAGNPWAAVYRDMQQRIANSQLENFPEAGHAVFADDPERFNSLLDSFLQALK